jgi:uncharacterized protein YcfL
MSKPLLLSATAMALLLVAGCASTDENPTASRTTTSAPAKSVITELPEIAVPAKDGLNVAVVVSIESASPLNLEARSFLYDTDAVTDIVSNYASDVSSLTVSANRTKLAELIEKALRVEDGFEDVQVRITSVMIQNV